MDCRDTYIIHLQNCIAQIWKMLILTQWYKPCKVSKEPTSIRRFLLSSSSWYGHILRSPELFIHCDVPRSDTRHFGRVVPTRRNGLGCQKTMDLIPPFWSGFYIYYVLVSWFVIGKSSNLLFFFAKSSHSWYRCKTLEKTFWKLSTWNESLVRKNMCQTKWLLLVSTKFNQWLGS